MADAGVDGRGSRGMSHFYVGGRYVDVDSGSAYADSEAGPGRAMVGQVRVERYESPHRNAPFPIVICAHERTMWWYKQTPDGRPGWLDYFLDHGFDVFLCNQVEAAASVNPSVPRMTRDSEAITTASEKYGWWGRAKLHTQWPGTGVAGDPVFDAFYANVGPKGHGDQSAALVESRDAAAALLDRIGPSIVHVHSQAGELGWLIGDARPDLVKAILALDPMGPPFVDSPPLSLNPGTVRRPYGLTKAPIAYDPPVNDPAVDLPFEEEESADEPDLTKCRLQVGVPRKLANLSKVKVLVVTGEATYHAHYDHCTVKYLRQGGVDVTHYRLEKLGIHGNGHMATVEKNNMEVVGVMHRWLHEQGLAP